MTSLTARLRRTSSSTHRTHALFAVAMGLASFIGLIKTAVFAKVLGAGDLGLYGLAILVTQFGVYLGNWGMLSALNNQLPLALGRGEARTPLLVGRALGAVLVSAVLTGVIYLVLVAAGLFGTGRSRIALAVAFAMVLATTLFEFMLLLLRVERRLLPLASMYVVRAAIAVVGGAVAGALWGFGGVAAVEVAIPIVVALAARRAWLPAVKLLRPRLEETRWLIANGAPIMVANVIVVASASVDRVFVAAALPKELGQYIFATLIVTTWLALAGIVTQALAPKFLFEHGAGASLETVRRHALRVVTVAAVGGLALWPLFVLATHALRAGPYADYRPGLDVMPILYLGGLLNLLAFPGFILSALRPVLTTASAAAGALVAAGGGAYLAASGGSLREFAWVFVAGQATVLAVTLASLQFLVVAGRRTATA